jgi:hypothetical protein
MTFLTGLVAALGHRKPRVRRKAAEIISYYAHDRETLNKLRMLSKKDPSKEVRRTASEALNQIKAVQAVLGTGEAVSDIGDKKLPKG